MAKRRYVAPARGAVAPACFAHPMFAAFAARGAWLDGADWPAIDALNAAMAEQGAAERFVTQDPALLADGLHYESRIAERGLIATRSGNWHDLLNALVWIEYPQIKRGLNARQVAVIASVGSSLRSRAQCALTHFDEGGAIVMVREAALLALWDAHDWSGLFWQQREAWADGRIEVIVFGHALMEHALTPDQLITAKCLAVLDGLSDTSRDEAGLAGETAVLAAQANRAAASRKRAIKAVARAVALGDALNDPQELRPLPLSGIGGWHPAASDAAFFQRADCFRPLRPGRVYPTPL